MVFRMLVGCCGRMRVGCCYAGRLVNARVSVERRGNEGCRFTAGGSRSAVGAGCTPSAAGADRESSPIRPIWPITPLAGYNEKTRRSGSFAKFNAVESQHNIIVVTVSLSNARPT